MREHVVLQDLTPTCFLVGLAPFCQSLPPLRVNSAPNKAACHFFIVFVRGNQRAVAAQGLSPFQSDEMVTEATVERLDRRGDVFRIGRVAEGV